VYWGRDCLPCADVSPQQQAGAFFRRLLVLWAPAIFTHVAAQSTGGVAGFKIFVFMYEISSLTVFPSEILDNLADTAGWLRQLLNWLSNVAGDALGDRVCPFMVSDARVAVAVQLLTPVVQLLCMVSVWALQRALLWLLARLALCGHLVALRIYMVLHKTVLSYMRTPSRDTHTAFVQHHSQTPPPHTLRRSRVAGLIVVSAAGQRTTRVGHAGRVADKPAHVVQARCGRGRLGA